MDYARKIAFDHNGPPRYKIKVKNKIDWFGVKNRVNSSNFNATILRNSNIHFLHVLLTCFLRVTASLLCRLQAVSKIHVPIYPSLISEEKWNCSTFLPAQQRNRDSGNTLPSIKTCENGWSNFSENLRIVALKLLELTLFLSPNLSIYDYFL